MNHFTDIFIHFMLPQRVVMSRSIETLKSAFSSIKFMKLVNIFNLFQLSRGTSDLQLVEGGQYFTEVEEEEGSWFRFHR